MLNEDVLIRIEALLQLLVARTAVKSFYTVEEFAVAAGRQPFTVRQWCNLGRIRAQKSMTRTGPSSAWVISHEELERFRREGLLPMSRPVADQGYASAS